jgi:hypothetical protein
MLEGPFIQTLDDTSGLADECIEPPFARWVL